MAVPITVKMPEPITAPIPSAVSDQGPRVFFRQFSGFSESRISLSIDLRHSSWLASGKLLALEIQCKKRGVPADDWREPLLYAYLRLAWPREAFLSFALFSPRGPVLGPFGAAFLRAARFTFLRSSTLSIALVFAMFLSFLPA